MAILSLIIAGADGGCGLPPGYAAWNGTSMASPHVAGVAALLYDRLGGERTPCPPERDVDTDPCAVDRIRQALFTTSSDLGAPGLDGTYGWGLVDAEAAVRSIPVPQATTITFAAETFVAAYGDSGDIGLALRDTSGEPLTARDLQLSFGAGDAAVVVSATTDGAGFARVRVPAALEPGPYDITARFTGEPGVYDPATATAGLTVERESTATSLAVTGRGVNRRLTAALAEDDGPALGDQVVSFYADGVAIGSGVTDRDGRISFQPPERYRADHVTFEAVFAGTPRYAPSSASHRT